MGQTDLHLHSSVSIDGEISPRGLAERCRQQGVTLAALTDHNDVSGTVEFMWRSAQLGVRAFSGVELDCIHGAQPLHILGYGIDIANPTLLHALHEAREQFAAAGAQLMDAVAALGIQFDRDEVRHLAGKNAICAEDIAQSALHQPENRLHPLIAPLLPGGALSDQPLVNFYWSVCAPGKPAYTPIAMMSAAQAIAHIHGAGGIAVLAHPGVSITDSELLDDVLHLPLDGVEAFSSYHTAEQAAFYVKQAEKRNLLITGGSDFHGRIKPNIELGTVDWLEYEIPVRNALLQALGQHDLYKIE